jgi:hypothetical protein
MRRRIADRSVSLLVLGIGLGAWFVGCRPSTERPGRPVQVREASLALVFKPGQVTTYHLVTEGHRQLVARGVAGGQVSEVPSGRSGARMEMTYTQSVQGVDPNGHALLDIRIDDLLVSAERVGDPIVDFNSARPEDTNKPLARLIGQGYQVELTPHGQVIRIMNVVNSQRAVAADQGTSQGKTAAGLLSDQSIRDRHSVAALMTSGVGPHRSGQSWRQVRTVSFDNLGSKSFEKVYTFRGLERAKDRSVAVIDLEGVLSSKGAAQAHQTEEQARALTEGFDTSFTYTGQCRLDIGAGQVEEANEVLQVQWIALDPRAKTDNTQGEPNSIVMRSTQGFQLRRVGQKTIVQPSLQSVSAASQGPDKARFALRFQEGTALEYRFTSRRDVQIQWDPNQAAVRTDPNNTSETTESLELVMVYRPVKVDPNGLAFIEATCTSVTAKRTQRTGRPDTRADAVEGLRGKTFSLVLEPNGRIRDAHSLDALLKEIGRLPFREDRRQGRIKDPEMISDVVATQWFLWDAIVGIDPHGAAVGQTWTSRLSVPTPMVMRKARDVRYTLEGIQQTPTGRVAVIGSAYRLSDQPAPASWPIPYSGRFRASGPFGMLGGYTALAFEGQGRDQFNLGSGVWERSEQQFQMEIQAALPPAVAIMMRTKSGVHPKVVIRQTIMMEQVK